MHRLVVPFTLLLLFVSSDASPLKGRFDCKTEGFVRHPATCLEFYRCVDFYGNKVYTPFHFSCPAGTVFDESLSICNHPWAVPECSDTKLPQPSTSPTTSRAPTTTTPTTTASTTIITTTSPEPTTVINGETFTVVVPSFNFDCTAMGTFPKNNSCIKFWLCKPLDEGGFEPQLFTCPEGYNYDAGVRQCLKKEDAKKCNIEESDEIFFRTGIRPILLRVQQLDRFFKRWNTES
eukprot:TRINITY_DN18687_c0_g1_i1.p1 TRINITY_DN18687_c0_g1~~TRINITY_DN18687_c0_g1_i1.p1  ORF type:complete len:234 (-),score=38.70 TRINITY_DN18687_c0_g1_i1:84-785(-)